MVQLLQVSANQMNAATQELQVVFTPNTYGSDPFVFVLDNHDDLSVR